MESYPVKLLFGFVLFIFITSMIATWGWLHYRSIPRRNFVRDDTFLRELLRYLDRRTSELRKRENELPEGIAKDGIIAEKCKIYRRSSATLTLNRFQDIYDLDPAKHFSSYAKVIADIYDCENIGGPLPDDPRWERAETIGLAIRRALQGMENRLDAINNADESNIEILEREYCYYLSATGIPSLYNSYINDYGEDDIALSSTLRRFDPEILRRIAEYTDCNLNMDAMALAHHIATTLAPRRITLMTYLNADRSLCDVLKKWKILNTIIEYVSRDFLPTMAYEIMMYHNLGFSPDMSSKILQSVSNESYCNN